MSCLKFFLKKSLSAAGSACFSACHYSSKQRPALSRVTVSQNGSRAKQHVISAAARAQASPLVPSTAQLVLHVVFARHEAPGRCSAAAQPARAIVTTCGCGRAISFILSSAILVHTLPLQRLTLLWNILVDIASCQLFFL